MVRQNPHQSFGKILTLVFGVAFGMIALIMVYKAVQDSTENRSKAAEEQITYKQWEFNGKDAEGWKVPVGTTISGGYLRLPITYQLGLKTTGASDVQPYDLLTMTNAGVNTVLPVGNKQIKFMIAVGPRIDAVNANPPVSTTVVGGLSQSETIVSDRSVTGSGFGAPASGVITGITYEEQQRNNVKSSQYTMMVSYATRENAQQYIQIPSVTGNGDGQLREIAITIPNSINEMRMGALNVQFTNVPPGSEVRIDWIRLVSPKGKIIPSCKGDAVKSVTIENRCAGLKAKSASYQCADGFTGSVGDGITCVPGNTLRVQVQKACAQHRSCPITPTPQCTPLPRCATEGEIGPNGQRVYCQLDPLPGMTYCSPTPTPICVPVPPCSYEGVKDANGNTGYCALRVLGNGQQYCPRPVPSCIPQDCAAPPGGCYYKGSTSCSCGTLVCSSSDCCSVEKKQQGYQCVQNCGPPVVTLDNQEPTTYSCLGPDAAASRSKYGCPVCLASNTMIATPNGSILVTELVPGMTVWTQNKNGERIAVSIVRVSRTPVAPTHHMIHLLLSDGREVWASPNHPTTDGREMKDLLPGFSYDDALVTKTDSVLYWDKATYDLLPSGDTGYYWANGILMGSTLK